MRFDVAPRWYAFVFGAPVALALALVAITMMTGSWAPTWSALPALPLLISWFVAQIATSGLEDPGWRGFALPLLQRTYSAKRATGCSASCGRRGTTTGITWLFVAWLLRPYGGVTLRAPATAPTRS